MNELMMNNPFLPILDVLKYVILGFPVMFLLLRLMTKFKRQDKWLILGFLIVATVAWFPAVVFNPYSLGFVFASAVVLAGYDLHRWREKRLHKDRSDKSEVDPET